MRNEEAHSPKVMVKKRQPMAAVRLLGPSPHYFCSALSGVDNSKQQRGLSPRSQCS
jgi:hypothetical protein